MYCSKKNFWDTYQGYDMKDQTINMQNEKSQEEIKSSKE